MKQLTNYTKPSTRFYKEPYVRNPKETFKELWVTLSQHIEMHYDIGNKNELWTLGNPKEHQGILRNLEPKFSTRVSGRHINVGNSHSNLKKYCVDNKDDTETKSQYWKKTRYATRRLKFTNGYFFLSTILTELLFLVF